MNIQIMYLRKYADFQRILINEKAIVRIGLPWAIGMFVIPYFNDQPIILKKVLISFPLWMLGGLLFGWAMNRWLPKEK